MLAAQRTLLSSSVHDQLLQVVPRQRLEEVVARESPPHRKRLYSPEVTLGLFVEQVISNDGACQDVVGRYLSQRTALGLPPSSLNTGPYCKARQRLTLAMVKACAVEVADVAFAALATQARWRGRDIKLIDGTAVSMPDTASLQAAFPQSKVQQPGVGFPVARVVGVISLISGCVSDWTVVPCEGEGTSESQQLWQLVDGFEAGELLIADRAYCSYFLLAMLQQRGIDFVVREHKQRKNDSPRNVELGPCERLITWNRPVCPAWMDAATYRRMPATLTLREVRDGNRLLVTSLCHAQQVPASEIGWLYTQRWHIELDFRAIKCVMQMDILRCRTPDMVRKEIAAHLLGYNLIRAVMGEAAAPQALKLRQLSFASARRAVVRYHETLRHLPTRLHRAAARFVLLQSIARCRIPDRPGRIEPRAIKRRPKPRPLLTVPRHVARERIRQERAMA